MDDGAIVMPFQVEDYTGQVPTRRTSLMELFLPPMRHTKGGALTGRRLSKNNRWVGKWPVEAACHSGVCDRSAIDI